MESGALAVIDVQRGFDDRLRRPTGRRKPGRRGERGRWSRMPDACHTFDRLGPSGDLMTADELTQATLTSLHGEFATVVQTADLLAA